MKISDFLFVRRGICLFCKEEETWGDVLCPDCLQRLEPHGGEYSYDGQHACSIAYFYNRFLQDIFRAFKFHEETEMAEPMGQLLAKFVREKQLLDYTCIVPVPMHPAATKRRGYNQVRLLAEELSRHTGLPVAEHLIKTRHTKEQNKLDRIQREKNLRNAFCVRKPHSLKGTRILLLDDFVTTGNTMKYATRALLAAEPEQVHGLAFTAPRLYRPLPLQNAVPLW